MDSKNHLSWYCDQHTSSELYSRRFSGGAGARILKRQNALLLSLLGNLGGKTVLDVGAGHGQLSADLVRAGARVTAYGSSPDSLAKICSRDIARVTGPLNPLPFDDQGFDVVVSFRTLSHVPDWRTFLSELCRVSRGKVAFDFVAGGAANLLKPLIYRMKLKNEPGTRDYTTQNRKTVCDAAHETGFEVTASEGQFLLPLVFHRTLKIPLLMPVEYLARATKLTKLFGGPIIMVMERRRGSAAHR
ncbi:MAG: class I SAM-dependent methyltransferase [Candidatus Aureabacteria bacterium]|nr:class I SAM-dependent methyltransferase [Candidatus Auribacterota bacterium]